MFFNQVKRKESRILMQEIALDTYAYWVLLYQQSIRISDYLIAHNYYEVSIYGMGRVGKNLLAELLNSDDISVKYIVDKKFEGECVFINEIQCLNPREKFPKVDIMIVAVPSIAEEIKNEMRRKVCFPIKSLQDILFVMREELCEK